MNSKNLFTANAIICLIFAIPLLFTANSFLSQYMIATDSLGTVGSAISKAYGGMILGLGVALWMGRHAVKHSLVRKILLWFILIGNLCSVYAYLPAALSGSVNKLIYSTLAITCVLAIWAALLLFRKAEK